MPANVSCINILLGDLHVACEIGKFKPSQIKDNVA